MNDITADDVTDGERENQPFSIPMLSNHPIAKI